MGMLYVYTVLNVSSAWLKPDGRDIEWVFQLFLVQKNNDANRKENSSFGHLKFKN